MGKDRLQGTVGPWQEGLQQHPWGLEQSCGGGSQGPRDPGLLSHGRKVGTRKGILCQGQVPLQCLSLGAGISEALYTHVQLLPCTADARLAATRLSWLFT